MNSPSTRPTRTDPVGPSPGRFEIAKVTLDGEAVGLANFALTAGRGAGTSYLWSVSGWYQLSRLLRATLTYNGRSPADAPTLHRSEPLPQSMYTDAAAVLEHGVTLGVETWQDFLGQMGWESGDADRVICHQVGAPHRDAILESIGIAADKDFSTFPYLGNIGTVSLPITAALAEEREAVQPGDRVAFLGIGSGLNCIMLGVEW